EAVVRPYAVVEDDPPAAAVFSFDAVAVVEGEPVDVEPVAGLGDLGGAVERVAVEPAEDRVVPVARPRPSPAAHLGLDDGEVPARVGMGAADEGAADRGEAPGGKAVVEMRCEAAPEQVVEANLDLVIGPERRGRDGVEHRS